VQGVILLGLQKFVRERFGESLWSTILLDAGLGGRVYLPVQTYPGAEIVALTASLSRHSGMSTQLVLESFGDALAQSLVEQYATEVDPRWKFFDLLVQGDELIERIQRKNGASMPHSPITGRWGREGEVVLSYQSPLPLCALVKGVVHGLGATLEQPVIVEELRCMAQGAVSCEFSVRPARERQSSLRRRLTPPPLSALAIKAAMLGVGDRSDRPSQPPSLPPPSMPPSSKGEQSAVSSSRPTHRPDPATIPPASGVTTRPSPSNPPGSAPGASSIPGAPGSRNSDPPKIYDETFETSRRRS